MGGGLVAGSGPLDQDTFDTGLSVLRAGLAVHVAGMLAFVLLASDYAHSVWKNRSTTVKEVDADFIGLRETMAFRGFVLGTNIILQAPDNRNPPVSWSSRYKLLTMSNSSVHIDALHLHPHLLPSCRAQHGPG